MARKPPGPRRGITYKAPEPAVTKGKVLRDGPHAHRCPRCRERFEDNCKDPTTDPVCSQCVFNTDWPGWRTSRLPQDCCRAESKLASPEEKGTYRLGGQSQWWICTSCKRTHPYHPVKEK